MRKNLNKISLIVLRVSTFILFPLSMALTIISFLVPKWNDMFLWYCLCVALSMLSIVCSYIATEIKLTVKESYWLVSGKRGYYFFYLLPNIGFELCEYGKYYEFTFVFDLWIFHYGAVIQIHKT